MSNLPVAAFLATELVRRRFRPDPEPPASRRPRPARRTRAALAGMLAAAAELVAPAGYRTAP